MFWKRLCGSEGIISVERAFFDPKLKIKLIAFLTVFLKSTSEKFLTPMLSGFENLK